MNERILHSSRALLPGTALPHNYIIESVLGEGGFGITYCCTLRHTDERVAVKEYFPNSIAYRMTDTNHQTITPYAGQQELFERERQHVLREASVLLEFRHLEHIVGVKDILEDNGTIYLVMEYIDGITLKQYVAENETLPFDELSQLITPVMRDLIQIHKKGLLHRDISPDNLILGTDNQLHLIDFGSADFESNVEDEMKTVILKSGFAPPEQYLSSGKLGAWTDVYGICATMYYTLTGFAPPESVTRLQKDELPSISAHAQIRSWQADVIAKGLSLHTGDRYQTMESLYQAMIIPPIEVTSQKNANIERSPKNDKTVFSSSQFFVQTNEPVVQKDSTEHNNANRKKRYAIGSLLFFCLLCYAGLGLSGVSLPLWPQHWNLEHIKSNNQDTDNLAETSDNTSSSTEEVTSSADADKSDDICIMVNLIGSTLDNARQSLQMLDSSIHIQTTYTYDASQKPDTIIEQSITSGTPFTKGTLRSILLTINKKDDATTEMNTTSETVSTTKNVITTEATAGSSSSNTSQDKQNSTKKKKKKTTEDEDVYISIPEDDEYDVFIN